MTILSFQESKGGTKFIRKPSAAASRLLLSKLVLTQTLPVLGEMHYTVAFKNMYIMATHTCRIFKQVQYE